MKKYNSKSFSKHILIKFITCDSYIKITRKLNQNGSNSYLNGKLSFWFLLLFAVEYIRNAEV